MPCPQFVIWAAAASLLPDVNTLTEYEFYLDGVLQYEGPATRVEICIDETTQHMLEVVAVHDKEGHPVRKVVRNTGVYVELHPPGWIPAPTSWPTATPEPEMACADLDGSGVVDFPDWLEFMRQFGGRCE